LIAAVPISMFTFFLENNERGIGKCAGAHHGNPMLREWFARVKPGAHGGMCKDLAPRCLGDAICLAPRDAPMSVDPHTVRIARALNVGICVEATELTPIPCGAKHSCPRASMCETFISNGGALEATVEWTGFCQVDRTSPIGDPAN
jgi:hypothetical protein